MGLRYYKPTSAGRRGASVSDFAEITDRKKAPEKPLIVRLKKKPPGTVVHNVEMQPGRAGALCRSAGTSAVMNAREGAWAQISRPSGEVRRIPSQCRATVGALGNADDNVIRLGKAGRKRHMGIRPHVRGVPMTPVAHRRGGGEGRSKGGRHPCSPTGSRADGGRPRKP